MGRKRRAGGNVLPAPVLKHPVWRHAQRQFSGGYATLVLCLPDGTIIRRPEHQVVWEIVNCKRLPHGWVVHHQNGIRWDNSPENLLALPRGLHMSLHSALTRAMAVFHGLALQEEIARVSDRYAREATLLLRRKNMTKKKSRIRTLDLKRIRLFLNMTMDEMAARVTRYAKRKIAPIPGSRVNEWERDARSVPRYIDESYFHMIVHEWGLRREKGSDPAMIDTDFASLVNPALGYAMGLYYRVRDADDHIHRLDVAAEIAELLGIHFDSVAKQFGSKVRPPALPPVEGTYE